SIFAWFLLPITICIYCLSLRQHLTTGHIALEQRIVFDFDGVLIHSHIESMVTAYNVAAGALLENSTELPVLFEELFSRNRCHVRTAGEMTVLACWCLEAGRVSGE